MSKKEAPLHSLNDFLPAKTYGLIEPFLLHYKVHLTITRSRATVLGNYRNAIPGKAHRITVNGNLNPFAFLITLLHELAHLITFLRYGNRVASHGQEWKQQFSELLKQFLLADVFPEDIRTQLLRSRKYDPVREGYCLIEELAIGSSFMIKNERIFVRQEKIRKRIKALEPSTGKIYLFSPVYEVKVINAL